MAIITGLCAHEILDSRGNPTIYTEMEIDNSFIVAAGVPSGSSTSTFEALELRDEVQTRYNGKGVKRAVTNVNEIIKPAILGKELNQKDIDEILISLDKNKDKSTIGTNAMIGVSICTQKALAKINNKELYEYLGDGSISMPIAMMNILNGGMHANSGVDIQEFMIVPVIKTIHERVRCASEIFHKLKDILRKKGLSTGLGDEGGYAPKLVSNTEALDLIVEAIIKAGYHPKKDVFIALDVAANTLYEKETDTYRLDNSRMTKNGLLNYYKYIANKYPIISIEDPFEENDLDSLSKMTAMLGNRMLIVGDDYFATNKEKLKKGIEKKAGNAILIKPNQIGTITEMLDTINLAKENGYKTIISHRSGETTDTYIADLSVGLNLGFIKAGSLSRGERTSKYNRLLLIEDKLTGKESLR
jgi:enolase